ncbi:MAG: BamA/TamA family outer membrane protein [Armatimonadota bacterium]|nr:BamA/TamA family outer membrane protein [Armatimonadota bacterium]MDR5675541.1 BamA/TamA family outer membrane protein [Armatimonadota bacterium]MDR5688819.1 BamA/TamA family outer membrane protein [Armatimonadota bacterium]MDR7388035.1 BamA/TamA family outer membrane protein [Armatimonadota bacterium]MDR7388900.1 BamA/TamA family outer membrane protein [Armatimonadota bacterium]
MQVLRTAAWFAVLLCVAWAWSGPGRAQVAATPSPSPTPTPSPSPRPARIVDIVVLGTQNVSPEVVYGAIGSRAGELLDQDRVRQDVEQILATGLFADVVVRLQSTEDGVQLIFVVVENPVVRRVEITGNTVVPTEELRAALGVREGAVLNTVDLRAGARAVEKLYQDRGYLLVRVADVEVTEDGTLRVVVREGTVERVELRGLVRTRPAFVQRLLTVREGEVFNLQRVNRDLQQVFDTGLFENVRAQPQPGSDPDRVLLVIELQERSSREFGFGLGYSPQQGILGSAQFAERNLHGMGRTLVLSYQRNVSSLVGGITDSLLSGQPAENIVLQYRDPWFGQRGQSLALELHDTNQLVNDTTLNLQYFMLLEGGSATLSRRLSNELSGSLTLRTERTDFTVVQGSSPVPLTPGLVHALRAEASYDLRDDPRNPRRGARTSASVDYAFRFFGADFEFLKYQAEYVHYWPLWEGTLVGRVRASASSGVLPIQEQYTLGGQASVRGLPVLSDRGNSGLVASVEFRLPLVALFPDLRDIAAVVFADAGGVSQSGFGFVDNWQFSYGLGVLVNSPIGPIRIDYAIGPDGRAQTWLYFGHPF